MTFPLQRTFPTRSHPRVRRAVTVGAVVLSCAATTLVVHPAPAMAWPSSTVQLTGHGYGHGRGMGQYGAYGYATEYGWTYSQILGHYYGGTRLATKNYGPLSVDLSAWDGAGSVTVTSGSAFTAGGVKVAAGGAARLSLSGGKYQLVTSAGCGKTWSAAKSVTAGAIASTVAAPASLSQMLTICSSDGTKRSYRGSLSLISGNGLNRVVNLLAMEDYLRGVVPRESPASWGDSAGGKGIAALQSQAVAARSYASVQNRYGWAKICDSQSCQVYGGAGLNGSSVEDSRTNTAVSTTAGKVLVNGSGGIISAEYSSSTGGWTAGGNFPAVQDLGDDASPNHDWSKSLPAGTVASTFGVGTLTSITMNRNGLGAGGGRVLTATVKGTSRTVTVSGTDFQYELGLLSDWFSVTQPAAPPTAPKPPAPAGTPTLYYTNSLTAPATNIAQAFGAPQDVPLACDFNGDRTSTGAVYRSSNSTFYIRDSTRPGAALRTVKLGAPHDKPVCGDWNGDGTDTVGVFRPSTARFYLLNTNARTSASPVLQVQLGGAGYLAVAGDWNGDHRDTLGVYDSKHADFYLVNSLSPGAPRLKYHFGIGADLPVAGDWDGNGSDSYGVQQRGNLFALTNTLGGRTSVYTRFGLAGDLPMAGDWNRDGKDSVGVGRHY